MLTFCGIRDVPSNEVVKSQASNNKEGFHNRFHTNISITGNKHSFDTNCPRFATMRHRENAGLGHKLSEVIFGMLLAEDTNATFVLDDQIWSHVGNHGSYNWLMSILPLTETEYTLFEFNAFTKHSPVEIVLGRWSSLIRRSQSRKHACHLLFEMHLSSCCEVKSCWCGYDEARIGSYDRIKWRMRDIFARSTYVPSDSLLALGGLSENEPVITIVWHVRQGDIVLHAEEEHFNRVASQVAFVLREIPFHVYIFGEGSLFRNFPFLPEMCQQHFQTKCSYPTAVDVRDTLYYMTASDILITSGSSFPTFAALLKTDGIVLYEYPKEGVLGIFELSEHGLIGRNGTIETPSLRDLQYNVQTIFHQKLKKLRTS